MELFKHKELIYFTSFTLFSILFVNCDPKATATSEIYNHSNDTLLVYVSGYTDTTYTMPKNSSIMLAKILDRSNKIKNFNCCPCEFDIIKTITPKDTSRHLLKEYKSNNLWSLDKSNFKCKLVIDSSDIK